MKKSKEELKQFFETGDKPTQQQYADLIDSYIDAKQPAGEANRRFVIDATGEVSVASEQKSPEYTLSDIINNKLSLLKDGVVVKELDLTNYIDDTNLARLVSGTVDINGIATFTRDDNSTFTVDLSNLKNTVPQYQAGTNITIDKTDVNNPIINALVNGEIKDDNFAVVTTGNISHTPKIGRIDKPFNNLNDVLEELALTTRYDNIGFKIFIVSDGTHSLVNSDESKIYENVEIVSRKQVVIKINNGFKLRNVKLNLPKGKIEFLNPGKLHLHENFDINVKKIDQTVSSVTSAYAPLTVNNAEAVGMYATAKLYVKEFVVNKDLGSTGLINLSGYDNVDIDISRLTYIWATSTGSLFTTSIAPFEGKQINCKIKIREVDVTQVTISSINTIVLFHSFGLNATTMNNNNYSAKYGGMYDIYVGDVIGDNPYLSFRIFNGTNSGIYKVKMNTKSNLPQFFVFIHPTLITSTEFTLSGYIESSTVYSLINADELTALEPTNYAKCRLHIKDLEVNLNGVTGALIKTKTHEFTQFGNPSVSIPIVIEGVKFKTVWNRMAQISMSSSINAPLPIDVPLIEFRGVNKFEMNGSVYLMVITDGDLSLQNGKYFVNYGKIYHNAENVNYLDERQIYTHEDKYLQQI